MARPRYSIPGEGYQIPEESLDPYLLEESDIMSEEFQPGQFRGSWLENFSGLQGSPRAPQSFGEGFLGGLTGSLGRAGTRAQERRAQFDESEARRKAAFDKERLDASRALRLKSTEFRGQKLRDAEKDAREAKKAEEKLNQEKPVVDDALIAAHPEIPGLPRLKGQRVDRDFINRYSIETPEREAKAAREANAAARAQASADRTADAAVRAAEQAKIANMDKVFGNVAGSPDIKGYPEVRDSYLTGKSAAQRGNSAGDIILMRMIAKGTDPTTGVREEEFKTFKGAQGRLAEYGIRLTSDMWGGGQLSVKGRAELMSVLEGIHQRKLAAAQRAGQLFATQAEFAQLDPNLVLPDFARPGYQNGSAEARTLPPGFQPPQVQRPSRRDARPPLQSFVRP